MFDVGFSELLLIAVVALVVLGPERLPKAARFAGLWVRRARAQWYSVKAELERELEAEDLKRGLDETRAMFEQARTHMRDEVDGVQTTLRDEVGSAQAIVRDQADTISGQLDSIQRQVTGPVPDDTGHPAPSAEGNDATQQP